MQEEKSKRSSNKNDDNNCNVTFKGRFNYCFALEHSHTASKYSITSHGRQVSLSSAPLDVHFSLKILSRIDPLSATKSPSTYYTHPRFTSSPFHIDMLQVQRELPVKCHFYFSLHSHVFRLLRQIFTSVSLHFTF